MAVNVICRAPCCGKVFSATIGEHNEKGHALISMFRKHVVCVNCKQLWVLSIDPRESSGTGRDEVVWKPTTTATYEHAMNVLPDNQKLY